MPPPRRERPQEDAVAALLGRREPGAPALLANIHGRGGSGRRFVVELACARQALACVALDGRRLKRAPADFEATLTAALRDSMLLGGVVFLHDADACLEEPERQAELRAVLQPWLRDFAGTVLLGSRFRCRWANGFRPPTWPPSNCRRPTSPSAKRHGRRPWPPYRSCASRPPRSWRARLPRNSA